MNYHNKIVDLQSLNDIIAAHKKQGHSIVFTNGCFDILHVGHVAYLQEAKSKGDILVVGINSDDSVKRLKGSDRPIQKCEDRMGVIAGLSSVDYVTSFGEDTPLLLIKKIIPDVLVKGGDWSSDQIVGGEVVQQNGGIVQSLQFIEGTSSSIIIDKIKNL